MVGGILFFVIELKLYLDSGTKNLAQLFLELLCEHSPYIYLCLIQSRHTYIAAAEENSTVDFANLRVYGLLTDLTKFEFYSYDPMKKRFSLDEEFSLETRRNHYCFGMIYGICNAVKKVVTTDVFLSSVTNKIFSIIMHGYVEGLEAVVLKSQERGDNGDVKSWSSFHELEVDYITYRPCHPDLLRWGGRSNGLHRGPATW